MIMALSPVPEQKRQSMNSSKISLNFPPIFQLAKASWLGCSLDAKLDAAQQAINDLNENNDAATINSLQAFINAVEAQRGNQITDKQANELIARAQEIIDSLSG